MAKLDTLKQEAKELGIAFNANIGEAKLSDKIEEYYTSQEGPALIVKEDEEVETEITESGGVETKPKTVAQLMGELAVTAEAAAKVTHIIIITDNDQRENNFTTTVSVTCGNEYFDLGTQRIPLNNPVEVAQGFIDVLKEIRIPMHIRQPDGSTATVVRNRYAISYEDGLKKNVD